MSRPPSRDSLRERVYHVIFDHDTPAAKGFDILLLVLIGLSVLAVMLESVPELGRVHAGWFRGFEWCLTVLFTLEYIARLAVVRRRWRYALSFYGVIDLMAILPTYLELVVSDAHYLMAVRVLRLLRIFRILKLSRFVAEGELLLQAVRQSRAKISVFLWFVVTSVIVAGTVMYIVEGDESGFTSIPRAVYWAIVTLTTVGYGDIAPQTAMGRFLASILMILGYGVIAVPTGIVTAEIHAATQRRAIDRECPGCRLAGHSDDAEYCRRCGGPLLELGQAPGAKGGG